jgi:sugar phosphate isomerase/epimerase
VARIAAICAGIRRLAPFKPSTVFCATGSRGDRSDREARAIVLEGLKRICATAEEVGVVLSLEPMTRESGVMIDGPIVATIEEALGVFADVGSSGSGLVVDVWHLWDSPGFLEQLTQHAGRITALQTNDYREPRSARDRAMPGDGISDVPRIFGALERGGFRGWYDLEVFSDELWQLPPREFMRRGAEAMRDCWRRQY